jgi:hypothetical protein
VTNPEYPRQPDPGGELTVPGPFGPGQAWPEQSATAPLAYPQSPAPTLPYTAQDSVAFQPAQPGYPPAYPQPAYPAYPALPAYQASAAYPPQGAYASPGAYPVGPPPYPGYYPPQQINIVQSVGYPTRPNFRPVNTAALVISWIVTILTLGYMLPWTIAEHRGKINSGSIAILTFLLGWTGIGWIVGLVMACSNS